MTIIKGKKASELEVIFQQQSDHLRADPDAKPFERVVQYVDVECDITLTRVPLDTKSIGIRVKADADDCKAISDDFVFSLLLASGTTSSVAIEVPFDCTVEPARVIEEAESHGFLLRLTVPENAQSITPEVDSFVGQIQAYGSLWLASGQSNIRLAPIDGYLEYLFGRAAGHQPKQITTDEEMQVLYTDSLSEEVMEYVKTKIEALIREHLGDDDDLRAYIEKIGKAMHLKNEQLRAARTDMLEAELDLRTPVPNLIRMVTAMTGLRIADAAGMLYELKRGIHTVLDKYLPPEEEGATVSARQVAFAKAVTDTLSAAFGGEEVLKSAWAEVESATQLKVIVDLDRDLAEPSSAAVRMSQAVAVSPKIAAMAAGEFVSVFGAILVTGGVLERLEPATPVKVEMAKPSGIIAVG